MFINNMYIQSLFIIIERINKKINVIIFYSNITSLSGNILHEEQFFCVPFKIFLDLLKILYNIDYILIKIYKEK